MALANPTNKGQKARSNPGNSTFLKLNLNKRQNKVQVTPARVLPFWSIEFLRNYFHQDD
jgi:hypothetical protein